MESLYTKYRPQTFEQVVGQSHVVETLKRAVLEGRTSHAYLFCGPRGTGKTTMARLLAKALMCESGPAALPDGTCEQCHLIAAGEHPDVIELDAASRTGVDNVREEIISRVNYAPTRGRCKVYIIDEVHMLTTAAFNALLKTLEEPPEHVVFIMCTTDPQKILPTILSRVQRFDFHAIGSGEMQAHLAFICNQEGFSYDEGALELVVRHARGGMRDALTSLEQLSVFGEGDVSMAAASDFLGEVSGSVLGQVSGALAARDVAALFGAVSKLVEAGRDLLQFTRELAAYLRDVYVVSVAPRSDEVVDARGEELEHLRSVAAAFGSPDRIARVLTILGDASSQMRMATNQRLVLEIAFTRSARPESDLTLEALAERVSDLERQVAILATPAATALVASGAPAPVEEEPEPALPSVTPQASNPVQVPEPTKPEVASQPKSAPRAASQGEPPRLAPSPSQPAARPTVTNGNLQRLWKQVVDELVTNVPSKGSLLLSSTAVSDDGEKLTISLPKGSRFAARMLERTDVRESIEPTVSRAFGPRQIVYVESSLASQKISRAEKPAASASRPAAPRPSAAPARTPEPAPAAPPAPKKADFPMPWDAPTPAQSASPQPAPADDVVPYGDSDVTVYEEHYEEEGFSPTALPKKANSAASSKPTSKTPSAAQALAASTSPNPAPSPVPPAPSSGLTPEFSSIASMLAEAFGQPVSVSVESAATTTDDEAAAELSHDARANLEPSFTDEPTEDDD
ncbi:DNA polymerase III subunit gamma/tau [Thermophilibacter immobilis]|uniref:DNA polymerase III subunit gamma/tau n=1 Tax=Thermophilibacter immobilis TaxID=2779519 RepID=A0A7S7M8E0_9ACTN|nr:DNA polymerase III subunit gamma/tau [Thermophilibacter immobilis]QOY60584.1 DNA polymerase III subunit gamma/tau [Thermophilibacter immobilis]